MAIEHGDVTRNAMCNAVLNLLNSGSSVNRAGGYGKLLIMDSSLDEAGDAHGTQHPNAGTYQPSSDPAYPNLGKSDYWIIAELPMSNPAFLPAGDDLLDEDGSTVVTPGTIGTAHANEILPDESCSAPGGPGQTATADRFEFVDGDYQVIVQGNVRIQTDTDADIALTSVVIAHDDTIAIRNLSYTAAP